jgi:2-iminobutanoate/2-iminopropanoate deaminase
MIRVLGIAAVPAMLCTAVIAIYPAFAQSKSAATRDNPEYFPVPRTAGTALPFSEAVKVGDLLYVSGQIGNVPGTLTLAAGGIGPETHQALDNIKAILDRHGSSLEQIVKCTVFLADIKDWPAFNKVYVEYFKANFPARSALAASGLAFNARAEIECIAFVPGDLASAR